LNDGGCTLIFPKIPFRIVSTPEQSNELTKTQPSYFVFESYGQILQPRIEGFAKALSKENFEVTLDQAMRIHNQRADKYIAKLKQQGISPQFY
jgi:hypothetical protein